MALTKANMAENLFEELGLNKREAKELVEVFFEEVRLALEEGEEVKLSGFGNFILRDKSQRPGWLTTAILTSRACIVAQIGRHTFCPNDVLT